MLFPSEKTARAEIEHRIRTIEGHIEWSLEQAAAADKRAAEHRASAEEDQALVDDYAEILEQTS